MNEQKLRQLFKAARRQPPPAPAEGFDRLVLQAVRHAPAPAPFRSGSVFDQLHAWFPRLAIAAAALIVLCVGGDLLWSALHPGLTEGVAQLSNQWLLAANGL